MTARPRILAFDTSGPHCAAALVFGDRVVATRFEDMKRGQADRLMSMLEEVLAEDGAVWEELDAIGVGIGPGNFTGIRISVSAARGLALALKIPAIGVSAFEILRGPPSRKSSEGQIVTLNGPRHSVYLQDFSDGDPKGAPYTLGPDQPQWTDLDLLAPPHGTELLGPFAEDLMLHFGQGAPDLYPFDTTDIDWQRAPQVIARIAAETLASGADIAPPAPLYIRPADAAPASDPPPVILP